MSGITTLIAFTGATTGFFGSGFTVTGLVFLTCCLKTGFLSSIFPAFVTTGCTGFAVCGEGTTVVDLAGCAGAAGFFTWAMATAGFFETGAADVDFFAGTTDFAWADLLSDAADFLTTGVCFLGLSFFTGFASATFLAATFLIAGFATFLGCTFLTALTGFFLIAIWLGFFCDKDC